MEKFIGLSGSVIWTRVLFLCGVWHKKFCPENQANSGGKILTTGVILLLEAKVWQPKTFTILFFLSKRNLDDSYHEFSEINNNI